MDRKSSRNSCNRPDRKRKKKFSSNQYTAEQDTSFTSASAAKLKKNGDDEIIINENFGYCFLEFYSVFQTLSTLSMCYLQKRN